MVTVFFRTRTGDTFERYEDAVNCELRKRKEVVQMIQFLKSYRLPRLHKEYLAKRAAYREGVAHYRHKKCTWAEISSLRYYCERALSFLSAAIKEHAHYRRYLRELEKNNGMALNPLKDNPLFNTFY